MATKATEMYEKQIASFSDWLDTGQEVFTNIIKATKNVKERKNKKIYLDLVNFFQIKVITKLNTPLRRINIKN